MTLNHPRQLPPTDTRRWVVRRKAEVLQALADGSITIEEACRRWELSPEELAAWQRDFAAVGVRGLRVTRPPLERRRRRRSPPVATAAAHGDAC